MDLIGMFRGHDWPSAREVVLEHAGGQDRDAPTLGGDRTNQVGPAADEQGLDV